MLFPAPCQKEEVFIKSKTEVNKWVNLLNNPEMISRIGRFKPQNFPEEILRQYIFRIVLFTQ